MDRTCAFISRVENVWGSSKLYIFKMERKTICRMYKTVGVSDGIYDIIKGTHHGLGLLIWDKLKTKNSKNIEERLE